MPGPQRRKGAARDPVADLALERDGLADHRIAPDDGVDELHVGPDHGAAAHDGVTLEDRARKQPDVGFQLDRRVDIGAGGIDHRDPGSHPPVVDPGAQLGFGDGELGPVVDLRHLHRVVDLDAVDHVTGLPQHRDDVGEVVLALGVLGNEPAQRRREETAPEAVDRRVDLVDRKLVGRGVELLDDPLDAAARIAHDPSVAGGVVEASGEEGGGGVAEAVFGGEHGERLGTEQRLVGEHDDDVVLTVEVVGERGEPHGNGVAGAALHRLLDELDRHVGDELILDGLGDVFGPVADDDDDAVERQRGESVEHVEHHRAATQAGAASWACRTACGFPRRRQARRR